MKERIVLMFFFVLVLIVCFTAELAKAADATDGWKLATERDGVTIYTRPHSGSPLKEFKAGAKSPRPAVRSARSSRMSTLIRVSCLIWQSADSLGAKAIRS